VGFMLGLGSMSEIPGLIIAISILALFGKIYWEQASELIRLRAALAEVQKSTTISRAIIVAREALAKG